MGTVSIQSTLRAVAGAILAFAIFLLGMFIFNLRVRLTPCWLEGP